MWLVFLRHFVQRASIGSPGVSSEISIFILLARVQPINYGEITGIYGADLTFLRACYGGTVIDSLLAVTSSPYGEKGGV